MPVVAVKVLTITALSTEHTRCSCCDREVDQRDLWGVTSWGHTTDEMEKVDRWVCADCFGSGCGSPRSCKVRGFAAVRPDLLLTPTLAPARTSPHKRVAAPRGGR